MNWSFRLLQVIPPRALAVVGFALLLALAAGSWHWEGTRRLAAAQTLNAQLHTRLQAMPADAGAPKANALDFAQRLPSYAPVEPVVRQLQRSSVSAGVAFVSVTSSPRDPTAQTLGRTDLAVTLRGAYPNLKAVLAESLDRFPALVLQRLTLQRMTSPTEVEAHAGFTVFTQPLPASGAGRGD